MANFDLTMVIFILTSITNEARDAFELPQNRHRLLPSADSSESQQTVREGTPLLDLRPAKIQLTLADSDKPYDPVRGFAFGSDVDSDEISVLLHPVKSGGQISRLHFCINFNWTTKNLVVTNYSRFGTFVNSRLHGHINLEQGQAITIFTGDSIQAGLVLFQLEVPDRGEHQHAYDKNWEVYREEYLAAVPRINGLALDDGSSITREESRRLAFIEIIGKGRDGTVYKAVDYRGFYFAVKTFHNANDPSVAERIQREVNILESLSHKNIVRILDKPHPDDYLPRFVMKYMELGTLQDYGSLDPERASCCFRQIFEALVYLHDQGYAHRDLKPANILISSENPFELQLADFGFARWDPLQTFCGSGRYCAPEIFSAKRKRLPYSHMVDIWAVGIMILEYALSTDYLRDPEPWSSEEWMKAVENGRHQIPQHGWERLMNLPNSMLMQNPYDKPTAAMCLTRVDDRSLDASRISSMPIENPAAPRKVYRNIFGDQISVHILRTWTNRDAEKDPIVAINLTKIYTSLGISRHVMRSDIKSTVHYAIRSQGSSQKHPIGTCFFRHRDYVFGEERT